MTYINYNKGENKSKYKEAQVKNLGYIIEALQTN